MRIAPHVILIAACVLSCTPCQGATRTRYLVTRVTHESGDEKYLPRRDTHELGVSFDRYTTRDAFDRLITFYVSRSRGPAETKLPLALFVQGSGCSPVFSELDGKVSGGLQMLLFAAAKGRLRVAIVEKPGVYFGDMPKDPGSAVEGSAEFRREHVLPKWVEALNAALLAAHQLPDIDWSRTVAIGHSEGGIAAAHLAAANPAVTHVALVPGGGPTGLFELAESARRRQTVDEPVAAGDARARQIFEGWEGVLADPDNPDKFWLGHPHRRWSSFLKSSPLQGLLESQAAVFLAHGTLDQVVPIASSDALRAELAVHNRDVTFERLEGADHSSRKPEEPLGSAAGFKAVLGRVVEWFLSKSTTAQRAVDADLKMLQGTWNLIAVAQGGENQPPTGELTNVQVEISGNTRTLKSGDRILSRSVFRISPLASPKGIDVTMTEGSLKDTTILGIYELRQDTQRLCLSLCWSGRPGEFSTQANVGQTLTTFKRATQ